MPMVEFCTHPIYLYEYGCCIAPRLWYIAFFHTPLTLPSLSPRWFLSDSSISPLQLATARTGVTKMAMTEVTRRTHSCSTALPQVIATLMYSTMAISATPSFAAHTETNNHRSAVIDVIDKGLRWYALALEFVRVRCGTNLGDISYSW
jgi:hypothetical protein